MFQPKCQSINYNRVTTTCQLLDTNVSDKNEIENGNQFENHKDWVYYGQKIKVIGSMSTTPSLGNPIEVPNVRSTSLVPTGNVM